MLSLSMMPTVGSWQDRTERRGGEVAQDLRREGEEAKLITNFEAAAPSTYFAELYQKDQLYGGHVIMLGADPESKCAVKLLTFIPSRMLFIYQNTLHLCTPHAHFTNI